MSDDIEMPTDWDDHVGWEAYFAALPSDEFWHNAATTSTGSFSLDQLGSLIDDFRSRSWTTLWFPGCGFSPLPRVFAALGFTVHATDIAPSAIEYQNNNDSIVQPLLARVTVENGNETPGCLTSQIHDFRTSFGDENIDAIFNIKSIQGLPQSSMSSAVRSHCGALRAGGVAFFDTMNVQGELRDRLEDMLADAGFYVPLHALNKWYRKALADTGISYTFILGAPIPQNADSRRITTEYRSKMEAEYAKEQQLVDARTKHAQVIYSTG